VWGGDETNTAADVAVVSLFVFTPLIVTVCWIHCCSELFSWGCSCSSGCGMAAAEWAAEGRFVALEAGAVAAGVAAAAVFVFGLTSC
jgi:hypothetical protein